MGNGSKKGTTAGVTCEKFVAGGEDDGEGDDLYRMNVTASTEETLSLKRTVTISGDKTHFVDEEATASLGENVTESANWQQAAQALASAVTIPAKPVSPETEEQAGLVKEKHQQEELQNSKKSDVEEDSVCFICFDGGDLVLCDRKLCPKAFHVSCLKRDADYFKEDGTVWQCGWHFCTVCRKPGSFQCYSCVRAYCKKCIGQAEFLTLGNKKGLCQHCLPIVKMIERNETISAAGEEVDFEDHETIEGLFKVYWEDLKRRLSLVMPDFHKDGKAMGKNTHVDVEMEDHTENDDTSNRDHDYSSESLGAACKKRKSKNHTGGEKMDDYLEPEGESWASAELLEFIEHMNEDPTKPLSRIAVYNLFWSYINRHKLEDARNSSQINCDERLKKIFGKQSVGRLEIIKQLQIHFRGGSSADGKKGKHEDHVAERPNNTEFAAITPKNIDLIYLRRALLPELLDDPEFHNKVVGTFVRIRVLPETYRLVLVTGTRMGEVSYKAGTKTTNIVLEILNLQKKEDVTVNVVSDQDFTEEECERLRQSIKYGFIKGLTLGQVEDKVMALREDKLNFWFESEKQRLSNLRDRASEKGRKKELRECVEKLQELSNPGFRAAKFAEAMPQVTSDPHMDPGYESDSNDLQRKLSPNDGGRSGENVGGGGDSVLGMHGKYQSRDQNRIREADYNWGGNGGRIDVDPWADDSNFPPGKTKAAGSTRGGDPRADDSNFRLGQVKAAGSIPVFGQVTRREVGREVVSSATQASGSASRSQIVVMSETEKMWHYQDPTGMVQGPFSMEQLRNRNTTGMFPPNRTIWKTGDNKENSEVLLTDALAGRFNKETLLEGSSEEVVTRAALGHVHTQVCGLLLRKRLMCGVGEMVEAERASMVGAAQAGNTMLQWLEMDL